jgi:4-amino-4-deoxy-L-arabinose transferase-like glycosyltransferase
VVLKARLRFRVSFTSAAPQNRDVVAAFFERLSQRRALVPWLVFVFGVVLLLPSIWSETSVTCSDEYVLTFRTPMEMNERGEWLTPWCNEQPRLRKPPLMYWLILAAYKVLGTNLVAARIWGVLAGAGLGVVACLMERHLFRTGGLLAGLLALASVGVAAEARQAMLDLPLALFASLAVLQLLRWLQTPALASLLLSAVWLGLSFLVKGPVGLLFFATAALAGFWACHRWTQLRTHGWHWAVWLLLLAAICVPWPLAMQHLWSDRFVQILGEELAERKFGNWAGKSPLSALGGALGLIFPWTLMGVVATWQHFRTPKGDRPREVTWLVTWILLSVTPFFFMKAFERYMLAVLPAQAVLASVWLQREGRAQAVTLQIAAVTMAVMTLGICGFLWWFHLAFWLCGLALAVAGWTAWRAYRPQAALPVALGTGLLFTVLLGGLYPTLGLSALPDRIQALVAGRTARIFADSQPSLLSMRLGYSVQGFDPAKVAAGKREAVFVEATALGRFQDAVRGAGLEARELTKCPSFFSRKAWLRFARREATAADWREAFRQRSLADLRPVFIAFDVTRPETPR